MIRISVECLLCPASLLTFQPVHLKVLACVAAVFLVEEQLEYGCRASSIATRSLLALPPKRQSLRRLKILEMRLNFETSRKKGRALSNGRANLV